MLQARWFDRPSPALPAFSRDPADVTVEWFGLPSDGTLEFDIVGQANHRGCAVAVGFMGCL